MYLYPFLNDFDLAYLDDIVIFLETYLTKDTKEDDINLELPITIDVLSVVAVNIFHLFFL